jgi:hypothetical protein
MERNEFIAQILASQDKARKLLDAQRRHSEIEAQVFAMVDLEIKRRAEQDRPAADRCPICGDEYGSLS